MSLAEAYKDGRELRRLLTGGYEEDLRQQRELKQAQIAESRQRTQASKDRIALAQKSEERNKKTQQLNTILNHAIYPKIEELKARNAGQEEYTLLAQKSKDEYGDILPEGFHLAKKQNQVVGQFNTSVTADNIDQYVSKNSLIYPILQEKIKQGNGTTYVTIDVGEDGRVDMSSIEDNLFNDHMKKFGILEELDKLAGGSKYDPIKARKLMEYLAPIAESQNKTVTITHQLGNGKFLTSTGEEVNREEAEAILANNENGNTEESNTNLGNSSESKSDKFAGIKSLIKRMAPKKGDYNDIEEDK